MALQLTYIEYLDELLLRVAACQHGAEIQTINLRKIHEGQFSECPDTWLTTAASEYHRMGYGIDWQDTSNESFRISGGGLKRVQEIRDERKTKTFSGRTKSFFSNHWIALAALAVSIFALLKS